MLSGYNHIETNPLPNQSLPLKNYAIINLECRPKAQSFSITGIKGAEAKINLLRANLAYGNVLNELKNGLLSKPFMELLSVPLFRLTLPTENFSLQLLKQFIEKELE